MSLAIKRGKMRGDPGLWDSIKSVGAGFLGGGVTGGMTEIGRTLGFGGPSIVAPSGMPAPRPMGFQINPPFGGRPGAGIQIQGPWGLGVDVGMGEIAEGVGMLQNGGRAAPSGYHYNKTGYFVKGPPAQYIQAGTKLVRNRRRNPLNPRAFDRALGRISSAKRFGAKLGKVTIRKSCACK